MSSDRDENVPLAFSLTLAAGLATTIGSSTAFFGSLRRAGLLTGGLALAAGVMIYVSFAEILAVKAVDSFAATVGEKYAPACAYACFFGGIAVTVLLDALVHRITGGHHHHDVDTSAAAGGQAAFQHEKGSYPVPPRGPGDMSAEMGETGECGDGAAECRDGTPARRSTEHTAALPGGAQASSAASLDEVIEVREEDGASPRSCGSPTASAAGAAAGETMAAHYNQKDLHRTGLLTALAIAIHNFPEGLATFVATLDDPSVGAAIAVAIAIHNIPEGVCVAMPVYYATGSRWKAFWWSFFSGVTEPVGALIGYFALRAVFSDALYGVLFGMVSGMMTFISVKELLPTARKYDPEDRLVSWFFVLGMLIMAISLVCFQVS